MIKCILISFLLCLMFIPVFSQGAEFLQSRGDIIVKDPGEDYWFPEIGDYVSLGDTVITGEDGEAELKRGGSVINISPDTIFTLQEAEMGGAKRDVFSCISGAVKFKIDKVTGLAPEINTLSAVAGVRGTEFTVFAGVDGSSLVVVTEGVVDVSASGENVELQADEGVEVQPGKAPGEKFQVLRGQLDFKEWNKETEASFLANPVAGVYNIQRQLENFIVKIETLDQLFQVNMLRLENEREKLKVKREAGEDVSDYYKETVFPLEVETSYIRMNVRYWALSALSLRRYVLTGLYAKMKALYITNPLVMDYRDFLYAYENTLKLFEDKIVPFLVEADI